MNYLIKKAKVIDPSSTWKNKVVDILIEDGIIKAIENQIEVNDAIIISQDNLYVSQGFVDIKANFCDPGFEHKETIDSGLQVAAAGGYTHVAILPSTQPVIDSKASVEYAQNQASIHASSLQVMGALTKNMQGEELAEIYDVSLKGVRIFTDDQNEVSTGILYRALLYTKNSDFTVHVYAHDNSLAKNVQVNEGLASVKTGLKGDPEVAELIAVQKYLNVVEYTNGKLHFSGISSSKSVELINKAKKDGLQVSCDVHLESILFNEDNVLDFDSNFKVKPVLRTEENRVQLINQLKNGMIDGLASNHRPNDTEETDVEFDYAAFGNINLQTAFSTLLDLKGFTLDEIVDLLSNKNRKLLAIKSNPIEIGAKADLTLFNPTKSWTFNEQSNVSLSKNSPFFNKELTGKVVGIINNTKLVLLEE